MTPDPDIATLAKRMLRDYDGHDPGTSFAGGLRLSIADAYALQGHVARLRVQRGEHVVGYKIGCVCSGNQHANGLSHPVYGRLWSTEQHANGVRLNTGDFADVAVEGELAVTLRDDVQPGDTSMSAIAAAVDQVFTVIELHNLRFHSANRGPELIANNAIHAGVVRSTGTRPPATEARTALSVQCDGSDVEQWSDRRWPDDVLQAVPWLVGELAAEDEWLRRGQMILTGAWGPPILLADPQATAAPGSSPALRRVEVFSTLFGSVAASFA